MNGITTYRNSRKNHRERGTTIVEAAIVLSLLMMVTIGAIEYGWMFVNLHRITNAARQGARVAAVSGAALDDGVQMIGGLLGSMPLAECTVLPDTVEGESAVTATVAVNSADISLVHWELLPVPEQLRAVVTMAREQQ